ncbi:hypothetical protein IHE45_17G029600, partial [Dioscorea alata]
VNQQSNNNSSNGHEESSSLSPNKDQSLNFGSETSTGNPFISVSEVPGVENFSSQSPHPIQTEYPASVFTRTSTTPMEWSVASNESLFSIHLGNSSFSRDHVNIFALSELHHADDLSSTALQQLVLMEPWIILYFRSSEQEVHEQDKPKSEVARNSVSTSHGSAASFQSFAFPILAGEEKEATTKLEAKNAPPEPQVRETHEVVAKAETPKAATSTRRRKWFACFSCCCSSPCCR